MKSSRVFTAKNAIIAISIAALCGILLRVGFSNEKTRSNAYDERSEWTAKNWDTMTDIQLEYELNHALYDLEKSASVPDNESEKIAKSKIEKIWKVKKNEPDYLSNEKVFEAYEERIKRVDGLIFSTKQSRIALWSMLSLSTFYLLLTSLRFALSGHGT
jgi:uncharacterized protein